MLNFFYNGLQKAVGQQNVHLLATDTDSFIVQIYTRDLYSQLRDDKSIAIQVLKQYIDHVGKGVIGLAKDETEHDMISEFVGLRSKMYSILTAKNKEKGTCKGVVKQTKKQLNHQLYKQVLFGSQQLQHKNVNIRSINHEINVIETNKISLSAMDNKRVFDGNKDYITLPIGYHKC